MELKHHRFLFAALVATLAVAGLTASVIGDSGTPPASDRFRRDLVAALSSSESILGPIPMSLAEALLSTMPEPILREWVLRVGDGDIEYAYGATMGFDRMRLPEDTACEMWAIYVTNARARGYLALFRSRGDTVSLIARVDSLSCVQPPAVRFLSGAGFGMEGNAVAVMGFTGVAMGWCVEFLRWHAKRLELLTPSSYPYGRRWSLLRGNSVQFEDVDGDSLLELVVYPSLSEIREGTKSASVPSEVFKFDKASDQFEEVPVPGTWKKH